MSTPLAEVYTHKFWKGRKWFGYSILQKSGFFRIVVTLVNKPWWPCVFPQTDRLWEGWSGGMCSCLSPIYTAACPACSSGQLQPPAWMCWAARSSPGSLVICLAEILPGCVQPQDLFCKPLISTKARALPSQMEAPAQCTVLCSRSDWQEWGKELRHRQRLQQAHQQSDGHLGVNHGLLGTFSSCCCSPVCSWPFASVYADHYWHTETLLLMCNI